MNGKAAIFTKALEPMAIREIPIPKVEPNGILVKVTLANICGSDVHIWRGDTPLRPGEHIIGHEMAGTVHELGGNIKTDSSGLPLAVGDSIVYPYFYFCGRCYACLKGERAACINMMRSPAEQAGIYISMGAYAEYYYLRPNHFVFKVPPGLTDEMVSPVNCALSQVIYGLQKARLQFGESVIIQGAGGLGLYATAVARDMGASQVIVIDKFEDRLKMASAFGADHVVNLTELDTQEKRLQKIRELTNGWGADVVVEVVGSPQVIPEGMRMLKNCGRYLVMGSINPKQMVSIEPARLIFGRQSIIAIATYEPWVIPQALDFLSRNKKRYPFDKLLSHKFPLEQINEAFQLSVEGKVVRAAIAM
ncbi:MAG: zinc-binding dehydrogenase [Candidatus Tectomicrobia bacterium]|uniref:Zinc-binding dehydrogenase n=1 Tax=Tectimicrobiota bacterium TaxID=2528274 RepID=A0A933GM82_UNCTE|nr:zinc-binding dehydrogenase [Candidatus Tectomicrobia bacterium]